MVFDDAINKEFKKGIFLHKSTSLNCFLTQNRIHLTRKTIHTMITFLERRLIFILNLVEESSELAIVWIAFQFLIGNWSFMVFYFHFVVHRYSTDELKYFPMNTAMFDPPKRMGTTLANPQEQPEPETASEEDENVSTPAAFLHFSYTHYCLSSIIIHSSCRCLCI